MAILPDLDSLLKRITDTIYKNSSQEIKATLHQKLLIDITETLYAQSGTTPNLQAVMDEGGTAVTTNNLDLLINGGSLVFDGTSLTIGEKLIVQTTDEQLTDTGYGALVQDSVTGEIKFRKAVYVPRIETTGSLTADPWDLAINAGSGQVTFELDTTLGIDGDKITIVAPSGTAFTRVSLDGNIFRILRDGDKNLTFIKEVGRWKILEEPALSFEWNRVETGSGTITADTGSGYTVKGGASPTIQLIKDVGNPTPDRMKIAVATDATSTATINTVGSGAGTIANLPNNASAVFRYDAADIEWYIESSHNL